MKTISSKDVERVNKIIPFKKDAKILSISHYGCMDGTISTIPIHNCFGNTTFMKARYGGHCDEVLYDLKSDKYDAVIMTDIILILVRKSLFGCH